MAASRSLSRRGGSGSLTLLAASPGRSAANATSMSPLPAMARRQTPTARLNGSVGASLAGFLGLMLELMVFSLSPRAGRGECSAQRHVDCGFRQLLAEAALIEFRHQRTLQL